MRQRHFDLALFAALVCSLAYILAAAAEPVIVPPDLAELRGLTALPKPHYSIPLHPEIRKDAAVLSEFVRITGACTVHPFWTSADDVRQCLNLCVQHGAELAIYYSPLLARFNKARKAAAAAGEAFDAFPLTLEVDGAFADELGRFTESVSRIAGLANARNVWVGAVILDQESMVADDVTEGVVRWKQTQFYKVARAIMPHAAVVWYGRGGAREAATPDGWEFMPYTSVDVPGTHLSVPLYWITETHHWRSAVRLTHVMHPDEKIIPFVSIGWQWTRDRPKGRRGSMDYPTEASFRIGAELNRSWFGRSPDRFLPNHAISGVVLYWTSAFPPDFWDHFTAYVSGATDVR